MRMPPYWVRITRARWFKWVLGGFLAWIALLPLEAQPASAVARFGAGVQAAEQQRYEAAAQLLRAARPHLPQLADHIGYWLGWIELQTGRYAAAVRELEAVWKTPIPSPWRGKAALLTARAWLAEGTPQKAVAFLRLHAAELPQPEGDALLGAALEAAGDLASAVAAYQRVYYRYPTAPEAGPAEQALTRLKEKLGPAYPPPMPEDMLGRGDAWLRARQFRQARSEFQALIPQLAGRQRELARVRVGVAMYLDYDTLPAYQYLRALDLEQGEADAERLYYLTECSRRLGRDDEMTQAVERLSRDYPASPWRLKALVAAGNRYLLENLSEKYLPYFRACYENFPRAEEAAYCHWKVTWHAYLAGRAEAAELLREHLRRFSGSEKSAAALYWLGRLAERTKNAAAAKAWYTEAAQRFPNHYYGVRARERLRQPELERVTPAAEVAAWLQQVAWPDRMPADGFEPSPATRLRLERARLLGQAGLDAWREAELRFGARNDGQPHVAALELARVLSRSAPPHRILQAVKELVPGYLAFRREQAPKQFWQFLFPFPYRRWIEAYARRERLDPFLLAGLVRQESEFNPGAVSAARAYGLTQILPSQGRILARQLKLRGYRTASLFQPTVNLRLGAYFLRSLLDKYGGRLEAALAAYNAGPNRVERWLVWARFEDPAEFIETIPFSETRTYVTAVLRNAAIYRELYGAAPVAAARPAGRAPATKPASPPRSRRAPK